MNIKLKTSLTKSSTEITEDHEMTLNERFVHIHENNQNVTQLIKKLMLYVNMFM